MIRAWLAYLLTLLCGGAFYLFYPRPLSFYTLLLLLVLPLLSAGLTLLSLRRLRLEMGCDAPLLSKGEGAFVRVLLRGPKTASGAVARFTVRLDNKLYPQLTQRETLRLPCNSPQTLELPTGHCGWLVATAEKCVLTDWLGLFPIPVRLPAPVLALVWPKPGSAAVPAVDLTPAGGVVLRPRPGGGPGEDYELRPYRPGDAVTSIHWKLTAKQPDDADPVLRETMEPVREAVAVTYDHFGPPDEVDALLEQLDALALWLLEQEQPFTLCWADPETGGLTYYAIEGPDSWQRCRRSLGGAPAPVSGQGVPDGMALALPGHSGPVRRIHLTLSGKEGPR